MKAIANALKGVSYQNPALGESLYELCRRATSRHIAGPDEILNQQIVYMINSEMSSPYAAKDACTCLKRRLQMDHPQKQYLAIILTSKVLQECHAAVGIYQGELLQEVAYILRTVRSSGPAAARTRQVAMDVLRHFGSAGGDAYRLARAQQGPVAAGYPSPYAVAAPGTAAVGQTAQDPAAVAAERESLLDEIKRMVEQAAASSEILNELTLNKQEMGGGAAAPAGASDDSVGLRRELMADVRELRGRFDAYMGALAALTGADAEAAMKAALEAVDQLDNALSLDRDVDAELKGLQRTKGAAAGPAAGVASGAADGASSSAAAVPLGAGAGGEPAAAAGAATPAAPADVGIASLNLIDLEDDAPMPAGPSGGTTAVDPFALPAGGMSAQQAAAAADPFAAQLQADPFALPVQPQLAATSAAAGAQPAAAADPFAALAAAAPASGGVVGAAAPPGVAAPPTPVPPHGLGFGGAGAYPLMPTPEQIAAAAADPFADGSGAGSQAPVPPAWGTAAPAAVPPAAAAAAAAVGAPAARTVGVGQPPMAPGAAGAPVPVADVGQQQRASGGGGSAGGAPPLQQLPPHMAAAAHGGYGMSAVPQAQLYPGAPPPPGYGLPPGYAGYAPPPPGYAYALPQGAYQYQGGPPQAVMYAAQLTGSGGGGTHAAAAVPYAAGAYHPSTAAAAAGAGFMQPPHAAAAPYSAAQAAPGPSALFGAALPATVPAGAAGAGLPHAAAPEAGPLSPSNPFAAPPQAGGASTVASPGGAGGTALEAEWNSLFKK